MRANNRSEFLEDEELKRHNEDLAREDKRNRSPICRGPPIQVTWTGTARCNMRCPMCQVDRRKGTRQHPDLPRGLLEKIAPHLFPTLRILNLTRRGEPFVDSSLLRIVQLCRKYNVKLDINTNGTLMNRKWSERLMPLLHDVKVSIDGVNSKTFERIRRGAKLGTVLDNVKTFVQVRREILEEGEGPRLQFEVTLMQSNIDQLPDMIRLASEIGVDRVKGYHLFAFWPEFEKESLVNDKSHYNEVYVRSKEVAKELGVETGLALPFLLDGNPPTFEDRKCPRLWRRFWIDFNGDLLPCTHPSRRVLGNVYRDNILEVWNSEAYQTLRKGEDPMCSRCGWLKVSDHESAVPYDDEFLARTWKILDAYRLDKHVEEKPVGGKWDWLWSRRTAQLPLP